MAELAFAIVDVFAEAPLSGNPLAVVLGADRLPDDVLRRIAREFNQSETTFVLPARDARAAWRLRSFTAGGVEVAGAGHNALGAWWWLASTGRAATGALHQELGDDVLALTIGRERDRLVIAMAQKRPEPGAELPAADVAGPLGLDRRDLDGPVARVISTGTPHLLIAARGRAAVDAARPDPAALMPVLARAGAQGCYLYALDPPTPAAAAYARFFNPAVGLWEDPATGSAAGPLAWWLTRAAAPGPARAWIEQGHALGRPSRLEVIVDGDLVTLVGSAVLTAEGRLYVHDDQERP